MTVEELINSADPKQVSDLLKVLRAIYNIYEVDDAEACVKTLEATIQLCRDSQA